MLSQLKYGRLDYCRPLDRWQLIDQDGQAWPILEGQRVTVGNLQGVQVYAVLIRDAGAWSWAVTEVPTTPIDGGYVSIRVPAQEGSPGQDGDAA